MAVIIIDGNKIVLSDEKYHKIKRIVQDDPFSIMTKKIFDLDDIDFYIADYQRGYRWTESQIDELIDDICDIKPNDSGYCLQPLVVKKIVGSGIIQKKRINCQNPYMEVTKSQGSFQSENIYELLDGQQRLTTLFFIIKILEIPKIDYRLFYEIEKDIDDVYMNDAIAHIKNRFKKKDIKEKVIENINKLFFIWYEADGSKMKPGEAEKVFNSINEGKVELTNAELFKALLLNPDNEISNVSIKKIAYEWDEIERKLNDNSIWYFLSNKNVEEINRMTRIDYVIELYAKKIQSKYQNVINEFKNFDSKKDRFSFLIIQKYIEYRKKRNENDENIILEIWDEIVETYETLVGWYNDFELYHLVGFLNAVEPKGIFDGSLVSENIFKLFKKSEVSKSDLKTNIKKIIKDEVFVTNDNRKIHYDDILYEYPNNNSRIVSQEKLRSILLFSNIFSIVYSEEDKDKNNNEKKEILNIKDFKYRFPFDIYNSKSKNDSNCGWDIEHIAPRELESNEREMKKFDFSKFKELMLSMKDDLDENDTNDKGKIDKIQNNLIVLELNKNNFRSMDEYKKCIELWKEYAQEISENPDNSLCNLCLLNSDINRSYGNAFFDGKRKEIILQDKVGTFIPVVTRNVFMKYYSSEIKYLTRWTDEDKNSYKDFWIKLISEVEKW